ncbi:hypothetical protein PybrP1_010496, partial [[Pythium] brassicae (nom. inval.)]
MDEVQKEHNVSTVFSADRSAICFEHLPRRTISTTGEKATRVRFGGKDKDQFKGMFFANLNGT